MRIKLLQQFLILIYVVIVSGCGGGGSSSDEASTQQPPATFLTNAAITVDGQANDWIDVESVVIDPQGDQTGNSSADLLSVSAVIDGEDMVLLMETAGPIVMPHTPTQEYSHYEIGVHFFTDSDCQNSIGFVIANNFTHFDGVNTHIISSDIPDLTLIPTTTAYQSNILETRFNASFLLDGRTYINFYPIIQSFNTDSVQTINDEINLIVECYAINAPTQTSTGDIVPTNSAPGVSNVYVLDVNGSNAEVGDELIGQYDFIDINSDTEGMSQYRWLRDGVPIAGALGSSYIIQEGDIGKSIAFEITPIASTGTTIGRVVVVEIIPVLIDPPTVSVEVNVTDAPGDVLSYRWRATDGQIVNINAATTIWTLPPGPGLHFAYVQVANGNGGYTERRVAVSTENIGSPLSRNFVPRDPTPPAAPKETGSTFRVSVVTDLTSHLVYGANIPVYMEKLSTGEISPILSTDLKGEAIFRNLIPGNYALFCSLDEGQTFIDCTGDPIIIDSEAQTYTTWMILNTEAYGAVTAGSALLADGNPCGIVSPFFNTEVTGQASFLNSDGVTISTPSQTNAYGDYLLPLAVGATSVKLECEGVAPQFEVATTTGGLSLPGLSTIFPGTAAPEIVSMSATFDNAEIGIFLPPPNGLPSDVVPRADMFLAFKGLDTDRSACEYYKVIGAVLDCDAEGNISGGVNFDDWKRVNHMEPYVINGQTEYSAIYVNEVDLNLTRNHHSISYGPDQTAAYVCNYLGPKNTTQAEVDIAVDNALNNKDLVACVAMDHLVHEGVNNGQAFTRFFTFGPDGNLLKSVNLDGRGEKFLPGTCIACHGGDHYAGKFPEDGTGSANIGAHFLPYDVSNFAFSQAIGLTATEQQHAIKQLNLNILNAGPTLAVTELIDGWYANNADEMDEEYLPESWENAIQNGDTAALDYYRYVLAPSCRTCHVAFNEKYNFDHFDNVLFQGNRVPGKLTATCGQSIDSRIGHSMPNSLVTFNRFWESAGTAKDGPAAFEAFYSDFSCLFGVTP